MKEGGGGGEVLLYAHCVENITSGRGHRIAGPEGGVLVVLTAKTISLSLFC